MRTQRWLLLLGSNLDEPERVERALAELAALGTVSSLTPVRRMPARGDASRHYYNALVVLDSGSERATLIASLKRIESRLGRKRDQPGEVAIDIDLLATCAAGRWQADPHALAKREFTQAPAAELLEEAGIIVCTQGHGPGVADGHP